MAVELEAADTYEDLQMDERQTKVAEKKSQKRWMMPVVVVATAVVSFGAGFAIAYFAVPTAGRILGIVLTNFILFLSKI